MRDVVIGQDTALETKPAESSALTKAYRLLASAVIVMAIPVAGTYFFLQVGAGKLAVWPYPAFTLLVIAAFALDRLIAGNPDA